MSDKSIEDKKKEILDTLDDIKLKEDDSPAQTKPAVRIRCRICTHENKGRCAKKNVKVATNKPRRCELFEIEVDKVPIKRRLKSTYVPFHLRDKDAYKAAVNEHNKQKETNVQAQLDALKSPDCLSRFRSTGDR